MSKKITQLAELTAPDDADQFVVVDTEVGSTKRISRGNMLLNAIGTAELENGGVTYVKLLSTIFSGQIVTGTNSGSAGGSTNFLNLGGIKICWGLTNTITTAAGGFTDANVNLPTTYAAAPFAFTDATAHTAAAKQFSYTPALPTTTLITVRAQSVDTVGGTMRIFWWAIGT